MLFYRTCLRLSNWKVQQTKQKPTKSEPRSKTIGIYCLFNGAKTLFTKKNEEEKRDGNGVTLLTVL